MTLLELLSAGRVEDFNGQRGARSAPDLFAADLPNLDLSTVDFSGANLEKADLSGTDLTDAILARACLDGADLTDTNLRGAVAIQSRWREAYAGQATLEEGNFNKSNFTEAVLEGASCAGATFREAKLSRLEARGAIFDRADFSEARMGEADLREAHLSGATLKEARLHGAKLSGAHLDGADLSDVRAPGADFSRAELVGASLCAADLSEARFINANLRGADLRRADLNAAELTGANLEGALLAEARLDGHDLDDLASRGAILVAPETEATGDAPEHFHFEDVSAAISGASLGVLWENEEDETRTAFRVAVSGLHGSFDGTAPALPVPTELTLTRGLVADEMGFLAVGFVERPSGVVAMISSISQLGDLGATSSVPLEYRPAVRPSLARDGDGFLLFGIGRKGPSLYIHRYDGASMERVFAKRLTNAMGFVGDGVPLLLTRGGVVYPLSLDGIGEPLQVPEGFPGRRAGACQVGGRCFVAWLPVQQNGFCWAELIPGQRPEVRRVANKTGVMDLTVVADGERPLVLFSQEDEDGLGPAAAWGCDLLRPKPFQLLADPAIDIEEIRSVRGDDGSVYLLCTTLDEDLVLIEVQEKSGRTLVQLP